MRLSNLYLLGLAAPLVTYAFLPQSLKTPTQQTLREPASKNVETPTFWSQDECSSTQLNMAFDDTNPSNMFDGPMALTKERDACGVGFIANTKSGGTFFVFFWQG